LIAVEKQRGQNIGDRLEGGQTLLGAIVKNRMNVIIGLHHPLDSVTNPEYKLLRFIELTIFLQIEEGTSF
jgi:hypothetical protein